jgi:hypothetical protein
MHIFEYRRTREIKSGASQPQHYQPPKHATNHHHHIHNVKQHSVTPEGWWARVGWEDIAWGVRWLPRFNFFFFVLLFVVVRKMKPFRCSSTTLVRKKRILNSYSSQLLGEPFLSKNIYIKKITKTNLTRIRTLFV